VRWIVALLLVVCFAVSGEAQTPAKKPKPAPQRRAKPANAQQTPAKWLWIKDGEKLASTVYLRKEFVQQGGLPNVRLYGVVDNSLTIWIDGKKVLTHDGWAEAGFKDVTALFNTDIPGGKHVIAIEAKNSGEDNPAGVLADLAFSSGWRDSWNIPTDGTWLASTKADEGWLKPDFKADGWKPADVIAEFDGGPWKLTAAKLLAAGGLKAPTATPIENLKVAKDFRVELLYSVPKEQEGSWVNLCVDPKGRLIVSDQYGGLYRVTPPDVTKARDVFTTGVVVERDGHAIRVTEIIGGSPAETDGQVFVGDRIQKVLFDDKEAGGFEAISSLLTGTTEGEVILKIEGAEGGEPAFVTLPRKPMIVSSEKSLVEKIPAKIGEAQGLLWAFDALYVVVNKGKDYETGLYRVTDKDGDDQLEHVELLRALAGGAGEHGAHAILLTPDKQGFYVVCGNQTKMTEVTHSRTPQTWDEDKLLPRIYGRGFMKGVTPPGGIIYKVDRDGKNWEVIAAGFRNQFDAAVNHDGELFTYDADMEWDMNCPWYRPTRICHVVSGTDWGWRNGSAKWPVYYPETLPPVVDIGPGSPTGVTFGYGTKFPAKYQNAMFICDWSYGKMYAVHMEPQGATYAAITEEFVTGTPLPLTDVVTHPDGSLYFTIGGRRVQSGLYRVTYAGKEPTRETKFKSGMQARDLRHQLEALHQPGDAASIDTAWKSLDHTDRFVRAAARTILEHQPIELWQDRALNEKNHRKALAALLALSRMHKRSYVPTGPELDTPPPVYPAPEGAQHPMQMRILAELAKFKWGELSLDDQIEMIRLVHVTLYRLGPPDEDTRLAMTLAADLIYPAKDANLNSLLTELMVFLQAPSAATKGTALLAKAPTQEEQIDQARHLRFLKTGWTIETRKVYLNWLNAARSFHGGANFAEFIKELRTDALTTFSEEEKTALAELINAPLPTAGTAQSVVSRPFVKEWKMDEAATLLAGGLKGRDFDRGRSLFGATQCFACHRFTNEGGSVGPDLTGLSGRFSPRDILESVLEPSKVISDQYTGVQIVTTEGKVVTGRIVNLAGDVVQVNTNMADPNAIEAIDRKSIEEMGPSKTSMMPTGLLNTLNDEELLDLMAYLLSRGDRGNAMFAK
jgi:putative heme-binding domain-containing protein